MKVVQADIAIVGAGGAGLRAAIAAAEANAALTIALISRILPMRSHTVAATQRYRKDDLSVERRLDRIGFIWNWNEYRWEKQRRNPPSKSNSSFVVEDGHATVSLTVSEFQKIFSFFTDVGRDFSGLFEGRPRSHAHR